MPYIDSEIELKIVPRAEPNAEGRWIRTKRIFDPDRRAEHWLDFYRRVYREHIPEDHELVAVQTPYEEPLDDR